MNCDACGHAMRAVHVGFAVVDWCPDCGAMHRDGSWLVPRRGTPAVCGPIRELPDGLREFQLLSADGVPIATVTGRVGRPYGPVGPKGAPAGVAAPSVPARILKGEF